MTEEGVLDAHIAAFGQNEARRIEGNLRAISAALGARRAVITLILNGCTDNSAGIAREVAKTLPHPVEICTIRHADKSNAMNRFFHELRRPARLYVCVDAYVLISRTAIDAMEELLRQRPELNAATGVANNGRNERARTDKAQTTGGVFNGQLYALQPAFLERIRTGNIRVPNDLYRGEGLMGFMVCTDLDPVQNEWEAGRLLSVPGAGFSIDQLSPFRWSDYKRHFNRRIRQARGRLESLAIGAVTVAGGFEALPRDSNAMIRDYLARHPAPKGSLLNRFFTALALRRIRVARPPSPEALEPSLEPLLDSSLNAARTSAPGPRATASAP